MIQTSKETRDKKARRPLMMSFGPSHGMTYQNQNLTQSSISSLQKPSDAHQTKDFSLGAPEKAFSNSQVMTPFKRTDRHNLSTNSKLDFPDLSEKAENEASANRSSRKQYREPLKTDSRRAPSSGDNFLACNESPVRPLYRGSFAGGSARIDKNKVLGNSAIKTSYDNRYSNKRSPDYRFSRQGNYATSDADNQQDDEEFMDTFGRRKYEWERQKDHYKQLHKEHSRDKDKSQDLKKEVKTQTQTSAEISELSSLLNQNAASLESVCTLQKALSDLEINNDELKLSLEEETNIFRHKFEDVCKSIEKEEQEYNKQKKKLLQELASLDSALEEALGKDSAFAKWKNANKQPSKDFLLDKEETDQKNGGNSGMASKGQAKYTHSKYLEERNTQMANSSVNKTNTTCDRSDV